MNRITPSLFSSTGTDDEWSLCNSLGKDQCTKALEKHWKSFFDRNDFVDIQSAGLNAVRIPIGYWAVDVLNYEPYVSGQYPYLIQAVQWAKEMGLQVLIDLHGLPGSQNGQDNSGLIGPVEWPRNGTNADRSLRVLRNLTEEFSRDEYGGVVTGIELMNEPRLSDGNFPMSQLKNFYADGYEAVREVDDSMNVTIHDAFWGPQYWSNYNPAVNTSSSNGPASSLTVDTHQYYAFPPLANLTHSEILDSVCNISHTLKLSQAQSNIPPVIVGEFSLETGHPPSSSSSSEDDSLEDDQARRTWYRMLFEAQNAAYTPNGPGHASIGWYYWTWKTEWDIDTWSYRRGVADGYIPGDVSNASTYAFPVLGNGCVDAQFNYTAPLHAGAGPWALDKGVRWLLWSALSVSICIVMIP